MISREEAAWFCGWYGIEFDEEIIEAGGCLRIGCPFLSVRAKGAVSSV